MVRQQRIYIPQSPEDVSGNPYQGGNRAPDDEEQRHTPPRASTNDRSNSGCQKAGMGRCIAGSSTLSESGPAMSIAIGVTNQAISRRMENTLSLQVWGDFRLPDSLVGAVDDRDEEHS